MTPTKNLDFILMSLSNMQTSEAPSWAATSDEPASGSVGSSGMAVLKGMDNSSDAGSERGSDYIGDVEHQSSPQAPESEEWTGPGGDAWGSEAPSTKRTKLHKLYRFFKFIIITNSLVRIFCASYGIMCLSGIHNSHLFLQQLLLIAQIVSVVYLPFDGMELLLKFFVGSFSVLIMLIELESGGPLVTGSPILTNWITRGYLYAFAGLVSMEENNVRPTSATLTTLPLDYSAALFIETASTMMFVVGCIYAAFGLVCGQRLYNKIRSDYKKRLSDKKKVFENGSDTKGLMS